MRLLRLTFCKYSCVLTYRRLGRNGQLGNQLWQIASTIGIARARGDQPGFPRWRYSPYFSVPAAYFPDLTAIDGEDLGNDWLQRLAYFADIEDHIRQIFTPSALAWEPIAHYHRRVLDLPHRTAIHVRRGDYSQHESYFAALDPKYYEEAMAMTRPPYLVFSDDIAWCRRNFPSDCIFMEGNRNYEDLMLMASCDAVIAANSTFSWWGAWLSTGRRIFPRRWYAPGISAIDPEVLTLDPKLKFPGDAILLES